MDFLRRAQEFVREVVAEFRKVTWPSRQELINSTVVVITVTVVVSLFLGAVDVALARIVERILR
ncbi:MAG: preprotein translocase subunit SecE [Candidatus Rokuibacteriota bacterium]|jgi:preprotein translocase subunit SecE|nr:MAG: preprotein translocase subunit SecE [Candidatus Rokubacteria bacterium]